MTLSSAECIREIESLGIRRVVLPRELSIEQIAAIRRRTDVELEAFVHGALCISYSGQCLASLSLGGRSANRGRCAQPCRLPYGLICDGEPSGTNLPSSFRRGARGEGGREPSQRALTLTLSQSERGPKEEPAEIRYPLSPHDLAAYDRLPRIDCRRRFCLEDRGTPEAGRVRRQRNAPLPRGHRRRAWGRLPTCPAPFGRLPTCPTGCRDGSDFLARLLPRLARRRRSSGVGVRPEFDQAGHVPGRSPRRPRRTRCRRVGRPAAPRRRRGL